MKKQKELLEIMQCKILKEDRLYPNLLNNELTSLHL